MSKCERCMNLKICEFYDVNDEPGYEELGDEGCDMFIEKVKECEDCIISECEDCIISECEAFNVTISKIEEFKLIKDKPSKWNKDSYYRLLNYILESGDFYNFCPICGKDLRYLKK